MFKSAGKLFASLFGDPSAGGMTFHPSQICPECGSRLMRASRKVKSQEFQTAGRSGVRDGDLCNSPLRKNEGWDCPNLDCPAQIRARIEHWCSREAMDIAGGDTALVAKLVNTGVVRDVAELYRLKVAEIAGLKGMDKASAKNVSDAIAASRKREAWRLLFGLDIPRLSAVEAQSLCRHFGSVDNVFAASVERLLQAEGVSAETARSIHQWHGDGANRRLLKRLFKAGLNFK